MSDTNGAQPVPPSITRGADYRTIFANYSTTRVTPAEFSLVFGLVDSVGGGAPFVQELATLVLTPQHAKGLAQGLAESVRVFEQQFGSINIQLQPTPPPIDQAALQAEIKKQKRRAARARH